MKHLLFAAFLFGACGPRAGDSCPPVPQPGQVCSSGGAVCVYQQMPNPCAPSPEYQCTNGRWVARQPTIPAFCDGGASDAQADAPKDVASDG